MADMEKRDTMGNKMPDWDLPEGDMKETSRKERNAGQKLTSEEASANDPKSNIIHKDGQEGLTDEQMKTGHVEHSTGVRRPPNYQPRGQEFEPPAEKGKNDSGERIEPAR